MLKICAFVLFVFSSQVLGLSINQLKNSNHEAVIELLKIYKYQVSITEADLNDKLKDLQQQFEDSAKAFFSHTSLEMESAYRTIQRKFEILKLDAFNKGGDAFKCITDKHDQIDNFVYNFQKETNKCISVEKDQNFANYIKNVTDENIHKLEDTVKDMEHQLEVCGEENDKCLITLLEDLGDAVNKVHPGYFDKVWLEAGDELKMYQQRVFTDCNFVDKDIAYTNGLLDDISKCIEDM